MVTTKQDGSKCFHILRTNQNIYERFETNILEYINIGRTRKNKMHSFDVLYTTF